LVVALHDPGRRKSDDSNDDERTDGSYPSISLHMSVGLRSLPSQRRKTVVPSAMIGRVSQATKNAQAVRDARN
jgi:hypothetical protein